jgi:glycosyltransferase involved in cell wall biosynthesis
VFRIYGKGIAVKVMTTMYMIKRGGAYDRFMMMLQALVERGCEVHCLSLSPIQLNNALYHNHVLHLPFVSGLDMGRKLAVMLLFPFWSLFVSWRQRIDLFVAFNVVYAFIQAPSKWMLKKPMVTFVRGDSSFEIRMGECSRLILALNKLITSFGLFSSDRVVTANVGAWRSLVETRGCRKKPDVEVLFNSIPPVTSSREGVVSRVRTRYGIPETARILLTAGIIQKGKGIETVIECLPKVGLDEIRLLIIGSAFTTAGLRYEASLKILAAGLGLEGKILFIPWLDKEELWKTILTGELFILASRSEGMPNVLLEALGLGLPCLGSDIPGIRDVLHYPELMFDVGNHRSVAHKVRRFLSDPDYSNLVHRLCDERKRLFLFDWKEKVFEAVVKGFGEKQRLENDKVKMDSQRAFQ